MKKEEMAVIISNSSALNSAIIKKMAMLAVLVADKVGRTSDIIRIGENIEKRLIDQNYDDFPYKAKRWGGGLKHRQKKTAQWKEEREHQKHR